MQVRPNDFDFQQRLGTAASLYSKEIAGLYPDARTFVIYFWWEKPPPDRVEHLVDIGHGEDFTLYRFEPGS